MTTVSFIGGGKLGTTLAHALAHCGYDLKAVSDVTLRAARESVRIIGKGRAFTDNVRTAGDSDIVYLCVPDRDLPDVAAALASSSLDWKGRTVFHTSGLTSSHVLDPLRRAGARAASFHPIQTFARKEADPSLFRGAYFGIEGDPAAVRTARGIIRRLGGKAILVNEKDKALYHAGCYVCGAGVPAIIYTASQILGKVGLEADLVARMLTPFAIRCLQNIKTLGIKTAFTGPFARGDVGTVRTHFKVLPEKGVARKMYLALSQASFESAGGERIPAKAARELKRLLEDK